MSGGGRQVEAFDSEKAKEYLKSVIREIGFDPSEHPFEITDFEKNLSRYTRLERIHDILGRIYRYSFIIFIILFAFLIVDDVFDILSSTLGPFLGIPAVIVGFFFAVPFYARIFYYNRRLSKLFDEKVFPGIYVYLGLKIKFGEYHESLAFTEEVKNPLDDFEEYDLSLIKDDMRSIENQIYRLLKIIFFTSREELIKMNVPSCLIRIGLYIKLKNLPELFNTSKEISRLKQEITYKEPPKFGMIEKMIGNKELIGIIGTLAIIAYYVIETVLSFSS